MAVGRMRRVSAESQASSAHPGTQVRLDPLFDNVPVPMLVLDRTGRVSRSNRAAREVLGNVADGDADGGLATAVDCVHSAAQPEGCGRSAACGECPLHRLVNQTLATGRTHRQVETKVTVVRGGRPADCYLLVSTAVAKLPEGPGLLVCAEDITARKQGELALCEALAKVEQLTRQKKLGITRP